VTDQRNKGPHAEQRKTKKIIIKLTADTCNLVKQLDCTSA